MDGNKFHYCCFFTAEDWANSICLAEIQERPYAETDQPDPSLDSIPELIPELIQELPINGQESALKCPKPNCDFQANKPAYLQMHIKTHVQCNICCKEFSGKYSKKYYKRHQLTYREKIVHICDVCLKCFPCASVLRRHKLRSKCGQQ